MDTEMFNTYDPVEAAHQAAKERIAKIPPTKSLIESLVEQGHTVWDEYDYDITVTDHEDEGLIDEC